MTQARNYVGKKMIQNAALNAVFSHDWNHLSSWVNSELTFFFPAHVEIRQVFIINVENNTCFHMSFLDYIPWLSARQNPMYWLDIEDETHSPRWWKKLLCLPNGNSITCFPGRLLKITTERNGIYSSRFQNLKYFSRFWRKKTKEIVLFHWK